MRLPAASYHSAESTGPVYEQPVPAVGLARVISACVVLASIEMKRPTLFS
jgi:hypothetical protein